MERAVKATARCLLVAIMICAWLAISNHCAIRAVAAKTDTTQNVCPFHSKPAKSKPNPTECCKILRAIANAAAKALTPSVLDLPDVDLGSTAFAVFATPKISFAPATADTGPPGKTSFLELNRSLRPHAPPFFA
jgi:hypothetical protein